MPRVTDVTDELIRDSSSGPGEYVARVAKAKPARNRVSRQIAKHCRKKRGKCRNAAGRAQAAAIGYSQCRRKGFRSIPLVR